MDKGHKKRIVRLIAPTVFLIIILSLMCFLRYIDASVILAIYVPIWIIGMLAARLDKIVFASVFIVFSGIGIIAEYLIHVSNGPRPTMAGAFMNTLILFLGLILGIVLQILSKRKLKNNSE
ncbi:hypothetical protein [Alkaliphilus sp. B6464]|uniref:hypothetical protein n=1 Tax=Alkaliphilus sp. B6464 TaxID=2731219 RepID=UPI001BAA753D|nr:hypothetical protein [Alkaliphilus sp. B6464]QUH21238.1 hypothetical protein HYG84_16015 [Alkaliphilus sp. B6464]